jgi:Rod binding domain-containing protein
MAEMKLVGPVAVDQSMSNAQSLHNLKSNAQSKDNQKIEKAAHDFESILIGQWLEEAKRSFASVPGGEPDAATDPGHDQLQSIAMQSFAEHMSKSGGLGIASMIIKQLQGTQGHSPDVRINKDVKPLPLQRPHLGTVKSLK